MTPLQMARAKCANYVGKGHLGEIACWLGRPNGRCGYFEKRVLPLAARAGSPYGSAATVYAARMRFSPPDFRPATIGLGRATVAQDASERKSWITPEDHAARVLRDYPPERAALLCRIAKHERRWAHVDWDQVEAGILATMGPKL